MGRIRALVRGRKRPSVDSHLFNEPVNSQSTSHLVTQELYRKNLELAHTNRTLSLLRNIDELVLQAEMTLEDLSTGIAKAIIHSSAYTTCGLFIAINHNDDQLYLKGYAISGDGVSATTKQHLQKLKLNPNNAWFSDGAKSVLLSHKLLDSDAKNTLFGSDKVIVDEWLRSSNTKSLFVVALMARQHMVGVLLVGMPEETHMVNDNERLLLERLSEAVGVALDNKLLFEENIAVLKKLKVSNKKLKALDEAKDEFISMASHQLRTPLTSVKGYLSMLAEGDAGELNDMQKKFIDQAFISSQRMVYLIADLLNVSRLKTGKFVIESHPVYLPDVIESEIAQLYETVKSRGLTMSFNKPNQFNKLNLDETKIRQVIMNFTDNAIYYTPVGGKITIALTETPKSVEFTVTDTGLGVPKADQQHLFTKFYRAGNARKARPDGTGLGLFMAKKVIVAQGGALVFKSTEGKGSTFGFSFPKEKLLA